MILLKLRYSLSNTYKNLLISVTVVKCDILIRKVFLLRFKSLYIAKTLLDTSPVLLQLTYISLLDKVLAIVIDDTLSKLIFKIWGIEYLVLFILFLLWFLIY